MIFPQNLRIEGYHIAASYREILCCSELCSVIKCFCILPPCSIIPIPIRVNLCWYIRFKIPVNFRCQSLFNDHSFNIYYFVCQLSMNTKFVRVNIPTESVFWLLNMKKKIKEKLAEITNHHRKCQWNGPDPTFIFLFILHLFLFYLF